MKLKYFFLYFILLIIIGCKSVKTSSNDSTVEWYRKDFYEDKVPGISYEIWLHKNKIKKKEIIVATLDCQIDLKHVNLINKIWVNKKEIPNNNLNANSNAIYAGNNGEIKYQGKKWASRLKMGFYSGAIDDFCVAGNETLLLLNTYKLKQIMGDALSFNFKEITNLSHIFYGLSYRYKLAGSDQNSHILSDSLLKSHKRGTVNYERTTKDQVYENARKIPFGLSAGAGTKVELQIVFSDFIPVFQYLFKRHFIIYGSGLDVALRRDAERSIKKIRTKITKQLNPTNLPPSDIIKLNKDYHNNLYTRLNQELSTQYANVLPTATNGFDYHNQYRAYMTVAKEFSDYLSLKKNTRIIELDIHNTMEALAYMSVMLDLKLTIEAKIGLEASAGFKLGAGATVRLALTGEIALIDNSLLIDKGIPVAITDPGDPLNAVLQDIKTSLETEADEAREKFNLVRESLAHLINA